jgi:Protein-tyrosine phosphatase
LADRRLGYFGDNHCPWYCVLCLLSKETKSKITKVKDPQIFTSQSAFGTFCRQYSLTNDQWTLEKTKYQMEEEYKRIQLLTDNLDKTTIVSAANKKLNRYSNIFPYDDNRVKLYVGALENDYINASYINVS